jgi:hypothetical protein
VSGESFASITASDSDLSRAFLITSRAEEVHHKTERPDWKAARGKRVHPLNIVLH